MTIGNLRQVTAGDRRKPEEGVSGRLAETPAAGCFLCTISETKPPRPGPVVLDLAPIDVSSPATARHPDGCRRFVEGDLHTRPTRESLIESACERGRDFVVDR